MIAKLLGMQFANQCPYCGSEGGTSLENQELNLKDNQLFITNGFECNYCCDVWQQEIIVELGDTIKNHVSTWQDESEDENIPPKNCEICGKDTLHGKLCEECCED